MNELMHVHMFSVLYSSYGRELPDARRCLLLATYCGCFRMVLKHMQGEQVFHFLGGGAFLPTSDIQHSLSVAGMSCSSMIHSWEFGMQMPGHLFALAGVLRYSVVVRCCRLAPYLGRKIGGQGAVVFAQHNEAAANLYAVKFIFSQNAFEIEKRAAHTKVRPSPCDMVDA